MRWSLLLFVAPTFWLLGCDSSTESSSAEVEERLSAIEAEACSHMLDGPNTALTLSGAADASTETEAMDWIHMRFDLTLVAADESFVGYVQYAASEDGDYLIFLDGEASVTIDGVQPVESASVPRCDAIASRHVFDLSAGSHVIEVRAETETIRLVLEPDRHGEHGGHDHDHGHGHGDDDHSDDHHDGDHHDDNDQDESDSDPEDEN